MAMIANATIKVELRFVDRDNNHGAVSYLVGSDSALGDVYSDAVTMGAKVQAISNATLDGISVSYGAEDIAPAQPVEASDVERKGVFTFRDDQGYKLTAAVPSIMNTVVIDETNVIDAANTDVAAFVLAMTGTVLTVPPISNHGNGLNSLARARKSHRKSSKG